MLNRAYILKLAGLETESFDPRFAALSSWNESRIVEAILKEETIACRAVSRNSRAVVKVAGLMRKSLACGGRVFMIGAGTSGRIAASQCAEMIPTFGVPASRFIAVVAGGKKALSRPIEGAEDDERESVRTLKRHGLSKRDCAIGISASGSARFVTSALGFGADRIGCSTALLTCTSKSIQILPRSTFVARILTGPEVLAGSTRMKAGTACKIFLDAATTCAMVKLGYARGNLMTNLKPTSLKLKARAVRVLSAVCGISLEKSLEVLEACKFSIPHALKKLNADG